MGRTQTIGDWLSKLRIAKKERALRMKVRKLFKEMERALAMEIRETSKPGEYLEAVIRLQDLDLLYSLLNGQLGPAMKVSGREASFPKDIQGLVESLGGLRVEQSFFYKQEGRQVIYAAIWPWQSDPNRITLKSGLSEVAPMSSYD